MSVPSLPELAVSHWQAAWPLDLEAAAGAALYVWATTRLRGRWPVRRTASFVAGVGCVVVALQSGLGAFDEQLLSVHMVQHLVLLLVAPLLLLGGRPVVLALRALPAHRRALGRTLVAAHPVGCPVFGLTLFYVVILGTHVPVVYDATLRHPALHDLEHVLYLITGLVFLWPLFGHPATRQHLGGLGSIIYVIASMPACAIVGAFLYRHLTVVYAPYAGADRLLGVSAVADQQQAGAIMWVGAHVILAALALWCLGSKLAAEERRQRARDAHEDWLRDAAAAAAGRPAGDVW